MTGPVHGTCPPRTRPALDGVGHLPLAERNIPPILQRVVDR
jgi:hypothetical protein